MSGGQPLPSCRTSNLNPPGLTSRRSQPPLALAVPLSRFTSRVGGGSAFYVRLLARDDFQTSRSNQHMNTNIDPEIAEVSQAVLQALLEIRCYQTSHKAGESKNQTVQGLVAAGALSPQTVARIGNHQTRFHGFPRRISQEIAVLDVLLADKTPPLHLVGFADGHVAVNEQL